MLYEFSTRITCRDDHRDAPMDAQRLPYLYQLLSRPALLRWAREGPAIMNGQGNFAEVATMLRRESVSPGRSGQLPGGNAWADDLKDLFEDGAFSSCLLDGLFAEHGSLVWAAGAMFVRRWLVPA